MSTITSLEAPAPRLGVNDEPQYLTAGDFLAALDPTSDRWSPASGRWVFRGDGNANWDLKASGVRDLDAFERCGVRMPKNGRAAWSARRDEQNVLLTDFGRRLDQAGISIPTKSPSLRQHASQEITVNDAPDRDLFPLMALAQHHGLPTLLLDLTRRARVAAYFAAAAAAGKEGTKELGTHLSVLALNITLAPSNVNLGPRPGDGAQEFTRLEEYQAPGGTNPNMHAQAGLFTLLSSPNDWSIEQHIHACAERSSEKPPMHRLVLPHSEARKLLRLLSYEGVDGASMFPGADGVVKAIREAALWNLPETVTVRTRQTPGDQKEPK